MGESVRVEYLSSSFNKEATRISSHQSACKEIKAAPRVSFKRHKPLGESYTESFAKEEAEHLDSKLPAILRSIWLKITIGVPVSVWNLLYSMLSIILDIEMLRFVVPVRNPSKIRVYTLGLQL